MQIVDANVLLYASNERSSDHRTSRAWLDEALSGRTSVGFAWVVLLTFLRVSTNPAVFPRSLTAEVASREVERWLEQPGAVLVGPTSRHLSLLRRLVAEVGTAGGLVSDAHLAALAIEHDAEVVSFDRDFGRFEDVRWRIPG